MNKWLEVIVCRTSPAGAVMGYGYWPVPDKWKIGGLELMARHIIKAVERWYTEHGLFENGGLCYRPVIRLARTRSAVSRLLGMRFDSLAPDDHRMFGGLSAEAMTLGGSCHDN